MPHFIDDMLCYIYTCNKERNEKTSIENKKIIDALEKNQIVALPVKGAMLLPFLYEDLGVRYSSDSDFLVTYQDIPRLKKIMEDLGYIQGSYSRAVQEFIPVERQDILRYRLYLNNEYPYVKHSGCRLFPTFGVDFRYALGYERKMQPINDMIELYRNHKQVHPAFYLLHLCAHFYEESKQGIDILLGKDCNIIKLCDIREFILKTTTKSQTDLTDFAKKYDLQDEVYLTLFYLNKIYNDGYEESWMEKLVLSQNFCEDTFGTKIGEDNISFNKSFWDRIFSCYNHDEIPDLEKIRGALI